MPPKKPATPVAAEKTAAAIAKCKELGLTIAETKTVERPKGDGLTITESLITVQLQDGTTLTVDAEHPEHTAIIERAHNRVRNQIDAGKRPPKKP